MIKESSLKNKSTYVVNSTPEIRKKYFQIYQFSNSLIEKDKQGTSVFPGFSNLLCDIFCSLFMPNPEIKKIEEIHPRYLINMTILEGLLVSQTYKRIRDKSSFSDITSIWATEMFAEKLLKSLSKKKWSKKTRQFEEQYAEDDIELGGDEKKKKKSSFLNWFSLPSLNNNQKKEKKIDKEIKKVQKKMSSVALKATYSVSMEIGNVKDVVEMCHGWELREKPLESLSYQEKLKLAILMKGSSKLRELAQLIGHMRQLALHSRYSKIHDLPHEIYNVVFGDDLMRIHPVEITYLSHPTFQYDFYQRLAYKKLMQYELKGTETTGQGSIIVCVDTSGSMSGKPEVMSKAVALGLLEIARADKRNFIGIIFGQKYHVKTFIFKHEEVEIYVPNEEMKTKNFLEGLFEFATGFMGGGTDFETPLNTAFSFREKDEIYQDADLIFVTDDVCDVSENFLEKYTKLKQKKDFRTYGILIGPKYLEAGTMRKFCDEVLNYHVFTEDMATDLFGKVSSHRKN
ncbi:hypothetical protein HZA55_05780 [Candidatus Poribacteria bacterium]|nr:hypothetical protein [Candidatus Poribacteria bacterium]